MGSVLHPKLGRHCCRQDPITDRDHRLVFSWQGILGHGKGIGARVPSLLLEHFRLDDGPAVERDRA